MEGKREWRRADARVLGQLLAAQNLLFVLPDAPRIAGFFAEALADLPGVAAAAVCLGTARAGAGVGAIAADAACAACPLARNPGADAWAPPRDLACGLAARGAFRPIPIRTNDRTYGFFLFRLGADGTFGPYWPFLGNLANFVALSLDNRRQRAELERARDELEARTAELERTNRDLEEMNRVFVGREMRMIELKERIARLEGLAEGGAAAP